MTRVNKHDLDLHNRLVRELIESDPLLKEYKVKDLAVSEGGNKVALVLVKKEVEGIGYLMTQPKVA